MKPWDAAVARNKLKIFKQNRANPNHRLRRISINGCRLAG